MPGAQKPTPGPAPVEVPVEVEAPVEDLRVAAESTDPTVHYLIAVRDALSRRDCDTAEVTAQLKELGYR